MAKCEGSCTSQVQPSVVHPSGFLKVRIGKHSESRFARLEPALYAQECMCCRETFLREKTVTLSHCYDSSGARITGRNASLDVKLREPADCKCFRCGELSE